MGLRIEDGSGKGYEAKVDNDLRVHVYSIQVEAEAEQADKGNAFLLHGECHLAAAASGALLNFTNDSSTKDFVVTRVYIDSQSLTTPVITKFVKSPSTVSNGTDVSSTNIVQKKFDSGATLEGTLKMSDGSSDLSYTGGTASHAVFIPSQYSIERNLHGTFIVTPNTDFLISWETEGGNATDGEIVSVCINGFAKERQQ